MRLFVPFVCFHCWNLAKSWIKESIFLIELERLKVGESKLLGEQGTFFLPVKVIGRKKEISGERVKSSTSSVKSQEVNEGVLEFELGKQSQIELNEEEEEEEEEGDDEEQEEEEAAGEGSRDKESKSIEVEQLVNGDRGVGNESREDRGEPGGGEEDIDLWIVEA